MNVMNMKKMDFETIPKRNWDEPEIEFDSLVIIPTTHKHDSGYRCMKYCAIKGDEPIAMLSGCSDVMHLDGIGGYGKDFETTIKLQHMPIKAWNMDCLPCGYLHIWCSGYKLVASGGLSDFELFTKKRKSGK